VHRSLAPPPPSPPSTPVPPSHAAPLGTPPPPPRPPPRGRLAQVRAFNSGQTYYILNSDGTAPDLKAVQAVCAAIGGRQVAATAETGAPSSAGHGSSGHGKPPAGPSALSGHKFNFTFLHRDGNSSPGSSIAGSLG
jgi:hypothetical protein